MEIILLEIIPFPKQHRALLELLGFMQRHTSIKPGCLHCGVYQAFTAQGGILYIEQWESKASLERHIKSNHYLRLLTAMELGAQRPTIRFLEVSNPRGFEFIESLRNSGREQKQEEFTKLNAKV